MKRYLFDTNHASKLLVRHSLPLPSDETIEFYLCTPVVGELWFMVHNSHRKTENTANLKALLAVVPVLSFEMADAAEFGRLRVELREKGRPLPQIDVQIASMARRLSLVVLTADKHFDQIDNLSVENWLTQ